MTKNHSDSEQQPSTEDTQAYRSLLIPFSTTPTQAEAKYRTLGLQKTKGTLFIQPPSEITLKAVFNAPPRPKSRMSSGAVALCKHFERIPDKPESKRDASLNQKHPFWPEPYGSNTQKTKMAEQVLQQMLRDAVWRNVLWLHSGVAIYEIRNARGWGMRWTLGIEEVCSDEARDPDINHVQGDVVSKQNDTKDGVGYDVSVTAVQTENASFANTTTSLIGNTDPNLKEWRIITVTFRGFLEPIEGMSHELPNVEPS